MGDLLAKCALLLMLTILAAMIVFTFGALFSVMAGYVFENIFPFLLPDLYAKLTARKAEARIRIAKKIKDLCDEARLSGEQTRDIFQKMGLP
jgi:hypothetical protein